MLQEDSGSAYHAGPMVLCCRHGCGKPLSGKAVKRFCSAACRSSHSARMVKLRAIAEASSTFPSDRQCAHKACSRSFSSDRPDKRFCSASCRVACHQSRAPEVDVRSEVALYDRVCAMPGCAKPFCCGRKAQKFCSVECRSQHSSRKRATNRARSTAQTARAVFLEATCAREACSKSFSYRRNANTANRQFCCKACSYANKTETGHVDVPCVTCAKMVRKPRSVVEAQVRVNCSRACRHKDQHIHAFCAREVCGKPFSFRKNRLKIGRRYCSKPCAIAHRLECRDAQFLRMAA